MTRVFVFFKSNLLGHTARKLLLEIRGSVLRELQSLKPPLNMTLNYIFSVSVNADIS